MKVAHDTMTGCSGLVSLEAKICSLGGRSSYHPSYNRLWRVAQYFLRGRQTLPGGCLELMSASSLLDRGMRSTLLSTSLPDGLDPCVVKIRLLGCCEVIFWLRLEAGTIGTLSDSGIVGILSGSASFKTCKPRSKMPCNSVLISSNLCNTASWSDRKNPAVDAMRHT